MLRPYLPKETTWNKKKVVIGVVKGDTHDIGKNLVKIMLDNAGFEMHDLGRNVPYANFVDTAGELKSRSRLPFYPHDHNDGRYAGNYRRFKEGWYRFQGYGWWRADITGICKNIGADGYAKMQPRRSRLQRACFRKFMYR